MMTSSKNTDLCKRIRSCVCAVVVGHIGDKFHEHSTSYEGGDFLNFSNVWKDDKVNLKNMKNIFS